MKTEDNFENLFKEQFKNFSPELPDSLNVSVAALAEQQAKKVRFNRRMKWILPSSVVVLGCTALALWNLNKPQEEINPAFDPGTETEVSKQSNNDLELQAVQLPADVSETLDNWENPALELLAEDLQNIQQFSTAEDEEILAELGSNEDETSIADDNQVNNINNDELQQTDETETSQEKKSSKKVVSNNLYPKYSNTPYGRAKMAADRLRNGALLVRLKTGKLTLEALREKGYHSIAKQKAEEIRRENFRIYEDFSQNFNFCKVYFFYSTNSEDIMSGNMEGVFLNENLEADPSIRLDLDYFMVADIGRIYETKKQEGVNAAPNPQVLDRAIVLSDQNFNQMFAPFPFYQKASWKAFDARNISKLSKRIHSFYRL